MPTNGVRGAGLIWTIKAIKLGVNYLNGYSIEFPISFVLKSKQNGRSINGKIEEGEVTGRLVYVELT
jgi:sulfate adenylyltransferase subunit 1 (EFTu-like GTPase family)